MDTITYYVFYYYILVNIITFILYLVDKLKAIKGKYRISEKTLIVLSIIGGSLGALLSMKIFRHKTRKSIFIITAYLMCLLHTAFILYVVLYLK
ncbi:MAG: hypothetical protein CSB16_00675 [Clostridiales bacterium]|nr:MAG: hypothetical protein CSB16_00675 [Clostridiales bacterium]